MEFKLRFRNWQQAQAANEYEGQRTAFLKTAPLPQNPPSLFYPVRCKVLRPFYISGKPAQPGDIVSLPWHEAESLAAINKCEIIQ